MTKREDGHIIVELDFVPVKERLPKAGVEVIAICGGVFYFAYRRNTDETRQDASVAHGILGGVTHWAEVPEVRND